MTKMKERPKAKNTQLESEQSETLKKHRAALLYENSLQAIQLLYCFLPKLSFVCMSMSLQLPGRRRTVGNRSNNNKSCNHGCDCDATTNNGNNSKYRPNRPIDASALFKRSLPFAIFFGGIMVFRSRFSSLPSVVTSSNLKYKNTVGNCELRKYPKRRYYGLNDRPLPDFLQTEYLYGELPRILHPSDVMKNPNPTTKLCVDQSEWYDPKKTIKVDLTTTTTTTSLPFVDGTNPSILKLMDNPRIDPTIREFFGEGVYYLATICMTEGQCSWNDSPEEIAEFRLSEDKKPSTVHTVLLLLNKNFETIQEATIHTKIDAKFGRIKANNQMKTFKLDDARLFTHNGKIWVSYREGKLFGYDKQVLNKLHFEFTDVSSGGGGDGDKDSDTKGLRKNNKELLAVTLLASDTETLCCGRNMALLDNVHTNQLQALTWVDPVTVVDVDVSKTDVADQVQQEKRRRLTKEDEKENKKKKSHFHGTNGFMGNIWASDTSTGLRIARRTTTRASDTTTRTPFSPSRTNRPFDSTVCRPSWYCRVIRIPTTPISYSFGADWNCQPALTGRREQCWRWRTESMTAKARRSIWSWPLWTVYCEMSQMERKLSIS
jgi:hypothetical protein